MSKREQRADEPLSRKAALLFNAYPSPDAEVNAWNQGARLKTEKTDRASENRRARENKEAGTDSSDTDTYDRKWVGGKDDHTVTSAVWWCHVMLRGLSHTESSATTIPLSYDQTAQQYIYVAFRYESDFTHELSVSIWIKMLEPEQNTPNQQPACYLGTSIISKNYEFANIHNTKY